MILGKLERVKLRNIWRHEALDFTTWLAKEDNISQLSEELGLSISVLETEHRIGSFNVDILCEEEETGKKIIIENQLEKTDHNHLGKIITYASGVGAEYIIWIASEIRDEHKSAVEWLNRMTSDELKFFLIKMEAWKIGESQVAPKFNVVEEPNSWSKAIRQVGTPKDLKGVKLNRVEFWTTLNDSIDKYSNVFNPKKASTDHWYNLPIGASNAHITIELLQKAKMIRINIYIPDDKDLFYNFYNKKDLIDKDFGRPFTWDEGEDKKKSNFYITIDNFDIENKESWREVTKNLVKTSEKLRKLFTKHNK